MFSGKIYNRLWKAIKDRINEAQKQYDNEVKVLEAKLEEDKVALEEKIVNDFLKKII